MLSKNPAGLGKERGSLVFAQQGPLVLTAWRDRKVVHTLSTMHGDGKSTVSRRVRENGKFTRKNFCCPEVVLDYTANMGGVDRADQLCRYYLPDRKTCRWNVKLITYLLEMCVVNAFILMKSSPNHQSQSKTLTLLDFKLELIEDLLGGYSRSSKRGRMAVMPLEEKRLSARCMPGSFEKRSWCYVCALRYRNGTQEKKHQTLNGCIECGKHLCLPKCFKEYHTKANLC